jgi:hypothetical protein
MTCSGRLFGFDGMLYGWTVEWGFHGWCCLRLEGVVVEE